MNNIPELLEWVRTINVKDLPYTNVVGIGWGPKIVNGQETDQYSVIFTVKEKKPFDQLKIDEVVPRTFNLNESIYITDVQEPILHSKILGDCHTIGGTIEPIRTNCIRRRPLKSGCESINHWGSYVATLGTFVIDKTDGQLVALSNNHVFGDSQVTARYDTVNFNGNSNTTKLSAYQPTGTYKTTASNDYIGMCKRPVVIGDINSDIYSNGYIADTSCDAAIVKLSNYPGLINSTSLQPIGFNFPPPYNFATDAEIDSLLDLQSVNYGAPLFRSGRTVGPVGSPGNNYSCSLSAYAFSYSLVGDYNGYTSYFSNSFLVRGNVVAGRGGDSGSMFLGLFDRNNPALSAWKIIGLLFAGPSGSFPAYTIGCRITSIANALNVAPWNGTTIPTISANTSYETVNFSDPATITSTVVLSGRRHYQLGRL
jgi:hypothetical protein